MCTAACESSYGKKIEYLDKQVSISSDNSILQDLQRASNLKCVKACLARNATKIT